MSRLIIDASAIGPLILPDERENLIEGLLDVLEGEGAVVPGHWRLEVANLALMAIRRGRMPDDLPDVFPKLRALAIEVDDQTNARAWDETARLADACGLTIYDAAYLELAKRLNLPLATLDGPLAKAAPAEGVALFGR